MFHLNLRFAWLCVHPLHLRPSECWMQRRELLKTCWCFEIQNWTEGNLRVLGEEQRKTRLSYAVYLKGMKIHTKPVVHKHAHVHARSSLSSCFQSLRSFLWCTWHQPWKSEIKDEHKYYQFLALASFSLQYWWMSNPERVGIATSNMACLWASKCFAKSGTKYFLDITQNNWHFSQCASWVQVELGHMLHSAA